MIINNAKFFIIIYGLIFFSYSYSIKEALPSEFYPRAKFINNTNKMFQIARVNHIFNRIEIVSYLYPFQTVTIPFKIDIPRFEKIKDLRKKEGYLVLLDNTQKLYAQIWLSYVIEDNSIFIDSYLVYKAKMITKAQKVKSLTAKIEPTIIITLEQDDQGLSSATSLNIE